MKTLTPKHCDMTEGELALPLVHLSFISSFPLVPLREKLGVKLRGRNATNAFMFTGSRRGIPSVLLAKERQHAARQRGV